MRLAAAALCLAMAVAPAGAQVFGSFNPGTDHKLPNGGRPKTRVAFPDIKDWSSLRITLERTLCYGFCPAYRVTIAGDGTVTWQGGTYVKVQGPATAQIPPEKVHALFERFRKAQFFWLLDSYASAITDFPAQNVSIAFDDRKMSVHDYAGLMIGMPQDVVDLENAIDETANTAQWIGTKDERIPHPQQP